MASGKKNYFRHSFFAFEDEKIQTAIDKLGFEGYAYYFILLETLAKKCEHEVKNPITLHQQTLRTIWRKHTKSCIKVVEKLVESGLFVVTFNESSIEFDIPNLSKYLGKYTNKIPPNTPNKRKEKKRKVNTIMLPSSGVNQLADKIITHLNKNKKTLDPKSRGFKLTGKTKELIMARIKDDFTYEDFTFVLDNKMNDEYIVDNNYYRPSTLFNDKNFQNYLNEEKRHNNRAFINFLQANEAKANGAT